MSLRETNDADVATTADAVQLQFLVVFVTLLLGQRLTGVLSIGVLSTARVTQVLETISAFHGR